MVSREENISNQMMTGITGRITGGVSWNLGE